MAIYIRFSAFAVLQPAASAWVTYFIWTLPVPLEIHHTCDKAKLTSFFSVSVPPPRIGFCTVIYTCVHTGRLRIPIGVKCILKQTKCIRMSAQICVDRITYCLPSHFWRTFSYIRPFTVQGVVLEGGLLLAETWKQWILRLGGVTSSW